MGSTRVCQNRFMFMELPNDKGKSGGGQKSLILENVRPAAAVDQLVTRPRNQSSF